MLAKNLLIYTAAASRDSKAETGDSRGGVALDRATEMELREPAEICKGLPVDELRELLRDVAQFVASERQTGQNPAHLDYWLCLHALVTEQLRLAEDDEAAALGGERRGGAGTGAGGASVHDAVASDVEALLRGKSHAELLELEATVQQQLGGGGGGGSSAADGAYWGEVLTKLQLAKAETKLREIHQGLLLGRLQQLEEQRQELVLAAMPPPPRAPAAAAASSGSTEFGEGDLSALLGDGGDGGRGSSSAAAAAAAACGSVSPDLAGSFSPELEHQEGGFDDDLEPPLLADDGGVAGSAEGTAAAVEDDAAELRAEREAAAAREAAKRAGGGAVGAKGGDDSAAAQAMVREEGSKGMEAGEEAFGTGEGDLVATGGTYWWGSKYRPRKPRYFNRVKTGYDWNKYNQTHYDHDNPPPKVVQGYKFNVFYPDLVDRHCTPKFFVEPADHPDFCILRFTAGPPYEDLAFKIINKEWGHSKKRGFRCVFERGILHLYFNFKREFYRR